MVGVTAVVGSLVAGARVLLRVLRALCVCCSVSPLLDSNPAWLLGPPAKRFAHIVWVGFDSSAVRWGPCSCLLGLPRLCSGGRGVGFSLFLVSAMFGRLSASLGWAHSLVGVCSWWFLFTGGWAVISALRAAWEHAPLVGVWLLVVVALVAYAVSGCPATAALPSCGRCGGREASLYSSARCCSLGLRACVFVCARLALCVACGGACCCASTRRLLFVGCAPPRRMLLVCCCLLCLSAIACCAFRERARSLPL